MNIFLFAIISFLISFADAMMSYISPIFIESQVKSTFIMGIVFAFSSVVGIICDLVFPKLFQNKPHFFFLKVTIISAISFPLTFLFFPQHIITLLLAMAVWGIYYELHMFSSFQFIHTYVNIHQHTQTWGILQAFQSSAYAIAPLLVVKLLEQSFTISFLYVFIFLGLALILTIIFKILFVKKTKKLVEEPPEQQKTWITEAQIWKLLFKKIWPLLTLQLLLNTIDASFWTIGTLFMQELGTQHSLGYFFLTAYIGPSILIGFILSKITLPFGKKKTALICSMIGGITLTFYFFTDSVPAIILATGISSIFFSVAYPELKAIFEDFISRLKKSDSEMIGMQGSSSSLAYIIGPILATTLATLFGIKTTFSILGLFLAVISLILLNIIPKKIRMPQSELKEIAS